MNPLAPGPRIYLSGRLTSDWQDRVIAAVGEGNFIDPRRSDLITASEYTAWNLMAIDLADIVFAYMERDNPSGYGLALEVGYAVARGKHVLVVDERSAADRDFSTRFATIRACALATFDALECGISFLRSLLRPDGK